MFDDLSDAVRLFERRVAIATRVYESALRQAHGEYYDAVLRIASPDLPSPQIVSPFHRDSTQHDGASPTSDTGPSVSEAPASPQPEPVSPEPIPIKPEPDLPSKTRPQPSQETLDEKTADDARVQQALDIIFRGDDKSMV